MPGLRPSECVAVITREGDKFEMVGWENDRISIRVVERDLRRVGSPICVVDRRDVDSSVWAALMGLADAIKKAGA